jgi:MFS transporter, putative metabolite:H+ symporter
MLRNQTSEHGPSSAHAESEVVARLDRVPTTKFHVKLASYLGVGTFFDGFDALSLAVVLPLVVSAFGISFAEAGLIISAGYLGQFIGAIAIGFLSDRLGRRPAFVICLAVFGLLSLGCALAWSAQGLLIFRLLQGLGLGAEVPVAATLMNEYLGRRSRGRIGVIYQSTFTWGFFIAPLVALILVQSFGPQLGWRILLGLGALPFLVAFWAWFALPESARWLASKGRTAEAMKYVSQIEQEAIARGDVLPEPETANTAVSVSSDFHLGEFFRGTYGKRSVMLGIVWFSAFFVIYGFTVWLPSMYVSIGGLAQSGSLVLTIITGAVGLVTVYMVAWLIERVGRKPLLLTGLGIGVIGGVSGVVTVGFLGQTTWPFLFASGLVITFGMTIPSAILYLYTGELYPTRMRGFATSTASSLNRVASIISPFIIGSLLTVAGGAAAIFAVLAGGALVAFLAVAIGGIETKGKRLEEISA